MRQLAIALICGCGSTTKVPTTTTPPAEATPAATPTITYYEGTETTTSPDGTTPFGPPHAVLVRRTVDPSAKTIDEYVVMQGEEHPATMTLRDGDVFTVTDPKGEFSGTLTFTGPAWNYTGWTYDIKVGATGAISGHGEVTAAGLKTDKQFADAGGTPRARIVEDLHVIDQATFDRRRAELLPSK